MGTEKSRVADNLQKYIKKSQWDKAIQALGRLAELEPDNAVHLLRTGDYYLKLGMTQKAVAAYHQAADVFSRGGFVVKALAAYKIVLRLDPQNTQAHEMMQGLHGQTLQHAAPSQPYIFGADAPLQESPALLSTSAADARDPETREVPSTSLHDKAEESEELDEGLIGVQPFNLQQFGAGSNPAASDPLAGRFEIERTAYAEAGDFLPAPSASGGVAASDPISAPSPQERRTTDVMPLFSSLTPEEFSEVVERMIHFQYPSGYRIIKEGDTGDSVYLISQGTVGVMTKVGKREIPLSDLKDNDFFGEVGFLTGRPRTASVITRTDTEILELRGEDLKTIIKKFPRVRDVLEGFYKARVRDALSKVRHTGP